MTRERVRIVLVEDDSADAELTVRAIRRCATDVEIDVVRDGAAALELLGGDGGGWRGASVVLLDLKLPKVDGLEVLRRIKSDARTRAVPVVVVSSSREDRDVRESYGAGANSYVVKPLDAAEFDDVVGRLAQYWLTLNQPPV